MSFGRGRVPKKETNWEGRSPCQAWSSDIIGECVSAAPLDSGDVGFPLARASLQLLGKWKTRLWDVGTEAATQGTQSSLYPFGVQMIRKRRPEQARGKHLSKARWVKQRKWPLGTIGEWAHLNCKTSVV